MCSHYRNDVKACASPIVMKLWPLDNPNAEAEMVKGAVLHLLTDDLFLESVPNEDVSDEIWSVCV